MCIRDSNEAVELQAESTRWRVTPKYAGPSYVLGDLATHPLFVAETIDVYKRQPWR